MLNYVTVYKICRKSRRQSSNPKSNLFQSFFYRSLNHAVASQNGLRGRPGLRLKMKHSQADTRNDGVILSPYRESNFLPKLFQFPPFRNVTNFTPINRETCVKLFERYRQTTYNSKKCKKYEICFTEKTALFLKGFQTLNTRPERTALSSNVDQF